MTIITYGQALHLAQVTPIKIKNLEMTLTSALDEIYSGHATIAFHFPDMRLVAGLQIFHVGITFTANVKTEKISDITVGHGSDEHTFVAVTDKEIGFKFPFIGGIEEYKDQQVIGSLETQSLFVDLSPVLEKELINSIKKKILFSADDYLKTQPRITLNNSILIHVKGRIWVDETLIEKHCGNLYIKSHNNEYRHFAYFAPYEVEKSGLTKLIEDVMVANGTQWMLGDELKDEEKIST